MLHVTMSLMKNSLFLGTVLTALLVTGAASAAKTTFTGNLDGASEAPTPVATAATGTATLTFDDQTKKLCGKVTHTGLSGAVQAAHLHEGAPGAAGNPFVTLDPGAGSPINVNITLDDGQITQLVTGQFYVNLHTAANSGGEIRGDMTEGGTEQACDDETPDAGGGGGNDAGGDDSDSGAGSPNGGGNDAGTVRSDAGSNAAAPAAEDDGCSTTGSAPGSGLAIAFGVGIAIAAIGRNRRKR